MDQFEIDQFRPRARLPRLLSRSLWFPTSLLTLGGFGSVVFAIFIRQYEEGKSPAWLGVSVAGFIVIAFVGLIGVIDWAELWNFRRNPISRERRVAELVRSLKTALDTIELIEREVKEGEGLAKRLEAEAAMHGRLAELNKQQASAVGDLLAARLRRGSLAMNTVFFGLGVVATLLIDLLVKG